MKQFEDPVAVEVIASMDRQLVSLREERDLLKRRLEEAMNALEHIAEGPSEFIEDYAATSIALIKNL